MPESGVVLPADSVGKALRTETQTTTFTTGTGGVVHQQIVGLGDPTTTANLAAVDANGRLQISTAGYAVTTPAAVSWTSASTGATYVVNTSLSGNISFWLYNGGTAFSGTAPVVAFEQSPDNANWAPLQVQRSDTGQAITSVTMSTLSAATALAFEAAMEGVAFARARLVTAPSAGTLAVYALSGGGFFEPVVSAMPGTALVKGTQQTQGFATQDLKDSGRSYVVFSALAQAGVVTEGLMAGSTNRNGTATAITAGNLGGTVSAGKTFRVQNISVSVRLGAAAVGWSRFALRAAGTVNATSPVLWSAEVGPGAAAVVAATATNTFDFPDGLEIAAAQQWGISRISSATTNLETITLMGYEY